MRLGTAIERLVDNYRYASDKDWIMDKVAWALYQTWKEADRNTDLQTETKTETQNSNLTFEKRTMRDCYNCKRYENDCECRECNYEPKDKPTISKMEQVDEPQTSGVVWTEDAIKDEPKSYSTWASTDKPQTAACPFDDPIPCEWVNCPNSTDCPYKQKTEPQTERSE